ncbi:uncharacterized protein LOC119366623 [Triticum dicoccoides]|uniref:uncharacterized protein LOC119366623 n=1 Tax=Triticum dicoccoides TaxID=85692 RepID=UPI00188F9462|nr:uncharacterized protein LOC119366623 [Triticum dicoccoides]
MPPFLPTSPTPPMSHSSLCLPPQSKSVSGGTEPPTPRSPAPVLTTASHRRCCPASPGDLAAADELLVGDVLPRHRRLARHLVGAASPPNCIVLADRLPNGPPRATAEPLQRGHQDGRRCYPVRLRC